MFAIGLITAGSLALGTGAFAIAGQPGWIALPCTSQEACTPSYAPVPSWPINDSGQTYDVQGDSPVAPVLVRVMATNGKEGYACSTELQGPQPTSPADAAKNVSTPRPSRQAPFITATGKPKSESFKPARRAGEEDQAPPLSGELEGCANRGRQGPPHSSKRRQG